MIRASGLESGGTALASPCAPPGQPIVGGFVLVPVASLMAAWRACQAKPLGIADFRAWLAAHEMVARRCLVELGRAPDYGHHELARILGVTQKRARASLNRLVTAGLIGWSDVAITFPEPAADQPGPEDSIGAGRGSLAIPRRILRLLAGGARPAIIATALGILLRCLSRRKAGFDGRGRLKASWIARVFDVDLRRVKAARAELIARGWIAREPDAQRAMNRWGRAYRIDLAWDRAKIDGRSLPPLPIAQRPEIATPSVHPEPLPERENNQEPAGRGPAGVEVQGQGEAPASHTTPIPLMLSAPQAKPGLCYDPTATPAEATSLPAPAPAPVPTNSVPAGMKPVSDLPAPRLDDVRAEDLRDVGRTLKLYDQAVARGLAGASEDGRLKFVAVAEHARVVGTVNAPGLFARLVRRGWWHFATIDDEDVARRRLRDHLHGPTRPSSPIPTRRSTFTPDARREGPSSLSVVLGRLGLVEGNS